MIKINKDALKDVLSEIFALDDTYDYKLTRVKEAKQYGTLTIDDFEEYSQEDINEIADLLYENHSLFIEEVSINATEQKKV